jgi:hypothetical protein
MREDEREGGVKRGEKRILFRSEPEYSTKFHAKHEKLLSNVQYFTSIYNYSIIDYMH